MVCGGAGEARFLPHSSWCLALLASPAPSYWLLYLWPVAEMCGINHGLFYYHFWNVSELWKPMMLHNFTAKHNVDADKGCLPHSQFGAEARKVFQALFPMLVNILRIIQQSVLGLFSASLALLNWKSTNWITPESQALKHHNQSLKWILLGHGQILTPPYSVKLLMFCRSLTSTLV